MLVSARDDAGPFLGREVETERLISLLEGIEDGGAALVLRGEPGIGKSRLLAETVAAARERGTSLGPLACGGRVLSPDTASDSAGSV
jgi:MoxR-like ATPase